MKNFSHPSLAARQAVLRGEPLTRHPRLDANGRVFVDPMPSEPDLIGLRPLTKEEQIARYDMGVIDYRLIPDENFINEDDFHDYLDGLPPEGLSPYELAGLNNIEHAYSIGRTHVLKPFEAPQPDLATPLPEGGAERAHNAGVATPDTAAKQP